MHSDEEMVLAQLSLSAHLQNSLVLFRADLLCQELQSRELESRSGKYCLKNHRQVWDFLEKCVKSDRFESVKLKAFKILF